MQLLPNYILIDGIIINGFKSIKCQIHQCIPIKFSVLSLTMFSIGVFKMFRG